MQNTGPDEEEGEGSRVGTATAPKRWTACLSCRTRCGSCWTARVFPRTRCRSRSTVSLRAGRSLPRAARDPALLDKSRFVSDAAAQVDDGARLVLDAICSVRVEWLLRCTQPGSSWTQRALCWTQCGSCWTGRPFGGRPAFRGGSFAIRLGRCPLPVARRRFRVSSLATHQR